MGSYGSGTYGSGAFGGGEVPDMPTVRVKVAFLTDPDAANPAWEDISSYVLGLTVKRGRQRDLDQIQAGVCTVQIENVDRRFDPSYTHSPHYPYVLPMRKIQVTAEWQSVVYYLFTGYVERWPLDWASSPTTGYVPLTATDGMAALANAEIAGTFPQELTGARIVRVLSAAAWPGMTPLAGNYWTLNSSQLNTGTVLSYSTPNTVIGTGKSLVQAVTFDEGSGTSALTHIQEVVGAERGAFFIDGQGRAVFQDRGSRYGVSSEVTLTDGTTSASRIPYATATPEFEIEQVRNEIVVTRTGGTAQRVANGASQTKYLRRTLNLTPPLVTDTEALGRANFELYYRKEPRLEFNHVTVEPRGYYPAWPHALDQELGDKVTVERTPAGGWYRQEPDSQLIERACFVESVAHTASAHSWETSYDLSGADVYEPFMALGTAALNSGATAVLAY